jgi:hypothetical protein
VIQELEQKPKKKGDEINSLLQVSIEYLQFGQVIGKLSLVLELSQNPLVRRFELTC